MTKKLGPDLDVYNQRNENCVKRKIFNNYLTIFRVKKGKKRLVYVYQFLTSNSNFKPTSNYPNIPISISVTSPLRKLFIAKHIQKSRKKTIKKPKT